MLPVPPSKINMKINGKNKTISLINGGEVNILKDTGLTDINFSCLLPNNLYPFSNYDNSLQAGLIDYAIGEVSKRSGGRFGNAFSFKPAELFLSKLKKSKATKEPMRFIITRMQGSFNSLFHTNMLVSVENYEIIESADDGTDVIVNLQLKQYRPYGTKNVEVIDKNGKKTLLIKQKRYAPKGNYPKTVQITNQQSLLEVSKKISDGRLDWRVIGKLNGITNPLTKNLKSRVIRIE